jgi:hypothetical protein
VALRMRVSDMSNSCVRAQNIAPGSFRKTHKPRVWKSGNIWWAEKDLISGEPITFWQQEFDTWRAAITWVLSR